MRLTDTDELLAITLVLYAGFVISKDAQAHCFEDVIIVDKSVRLTMEKDGLMASPLSLFVDGNIVALMGTKTYHWFNLMMDNQMILREKLIEHISQSYTLLTNEVVSFEDAKLKQDHKHLSVIVSDVFSLTIDLKTGSYYMTNTEVDMSLLPHPAVLSYRFLTLLSIVNAYDIE